jgi:hypothetical protein
MQWITVAGIRSTGVTASLGIAEHVATLLETMTHIKRSCDINHDVSNRSQHQTSPRHVTKRTRQPFVLPDTSALASAMRDRERMITIADREHRIDHAITWLGWLQAKL